MKLNIWIAAAAAALAGCTVQDAADPQASAELRAAAKDAPSQRFYEARRWAQAWTAEDRARALDEAIAEADRHGLDPESLRPRIANGASPSARDAALTKAA